MGAREEFLHTFAPPLFAIVTTTMQFLMKARKPAELLNK